MQVEVWAASGAAGPDVVQTLTADATGKMSVKLSRGVSGGGKGKRTGVGQGRACICV